MNNNSTKSLAKKAKSETATKNQLKLPHSSKSESQVKDKHRYTHTPRQV